MNRKEYEMAYRALRRWNKAGYKGYSSTVEGFLAAKSCLLKKAFVPDGDNLVIDPALVQVSYGDLPLPANITAVKSAANELHISWDAVNKKYEEAYDQIMMLVYDVENGEANYNTTGQFKYNGSDTLYVPPAIPERTYHIYAAFVAADRSRQSASVYLGTISN